MNSKSIIQVLGSLEELNISQNGEDCTKIRTFHIDSTNYGVLLYFTNEKRISFFNLRFSELLCEGSLNSKSLTDNCGEELYELTLLNVFHLSFNVIDIVCTTENIWTVGYKSVLDLKPYIKSAYEKSLEEDDFMDTEDVEYNPEKFVVNIDVLESNNPFQQGDVFIGCSFIDNGFVLCHKNSVLRRWQLELVLLKNRNSLSSDWTSEQFLNFPISFDDNIHICSSEDPKEVCVPVIVFIHSNDPERAICENLFGIRCLPSSAVCLVGHPDGKLLWSIWDKNKLHSSENLKTLLDTKQPIVGIYFFDDREESKDSGYMLIVGSLGQVTVISSLKNTSFSPVYDPHSFGIQTWHLKSSVVDCIVVKKCLLYFSRNGTLGIAELSKLIASNEKYKDSCLALSCTELSCILQMIPVIKDQGLTLFITSCGNLYLTLCQKDESTFSSSSLPLLMNECLTQSTSMQELLQKKALQSKLFAAISTFSSLKYSVNFSSEPVAFSISELNLHPRKYRLVINFGCLAKYRLDPELCHLSASVFTHPSTGSHSLLSKTVAYEPGDPSMCLEVCESVLVEESFRSSLFPLLVEVGLVLRLPRSWTTSLECSALSCLLPLHLRLRTLVIHEALHLSRAGSRPARPLLRRARALAEDRPVANVLLPRRGPASDDALLPERFDLCLSVSSVRQMMTKREDTRGVDPCSFVSRLLFGAPANVALKKGSVVVSARAHPDALIPLRAAFLHTLLSRANQVEWDASTHVIIPASLYKRAEDLSRRLVSLFGGDLESEEVTRSLLALYADLRRDVSDKLPLL